MESMDLAGLHRLVHRLTGDHARSDLFNHVVILALMGPLPSIGTQGVYHAANPVRGQRALQNAARALTVSPSEMCSYSPKITAPTESRSRFRARPNVCNAICSGREFQHFALHHVRQAMDAADTVGNGKLRCPDCECRYSRPSLQCGTTDQPEISAGLSYDSFLLSFKLGQQPKARAFKR